MPRFLTDTDYFQIKPEILKLLDGSTPELQSSVKLLSAEMAAISQIRNRLSGRFNCDLIFNSIGGARNSYIIMIVIDIALYHLYSQTGSKDVPKHRSDRYQDAIDWLKDASTGQVATDLPSALTDINQGDFRIWSASEPENHEW